LSSASTAECCSSASKLSSAGWGRDEVKENNWECWEMSIFVATTEMRKRKRDIPNIVFYTVLYANSEANIVENDEPLLALMTC